MSARELGAAFYELNSTSFVAVTTRKPVLLISCLANLACVAPIPAHAFNYTQIQLGKSAGSWVSDAPSSRLPTQQYVC